VGGGGGSLAESLSLVTVRPSPMSLIFALQLSLNRMLGLRGDTFKSGIRHRVTTLLFHMG